MSNLKGIIGAAN